MLQYRIISTVYIVLKRISWVPFLFYLKHINLQHISRLDQFNFRQNFQKFENCSGAQQIPVLYPKIRLCVKFEVSDIIRSAWSTFHYSDPSSTTEHKLNFVWEKILLRESCRAWGVLMFQFSATFQISPKRKKIGTLKPLKPNNFPEVKFFLRRSLIFAP